MVDPAKPPVSHQPESTQICLNFIRTLVVHTNKIFSVTMLKNPNYQYGPKDDVVPARLHFGEFVLARMWKERNKEAFINGSTNESTTYKAICQQAMNFAVSLTLLGVRKGDTIAICSENRPEFYSVVVGVACAGAVVTTINPGYTEGELKHIIKISKPKFVVLSPITFEMHNNFFTTHFNKRIILFGDEKLHVIIPFNDIAVSHNGTGNVVVNNRLARNVNFEEFEVVDVVGQTDTLFILYSSGTSGLPKGVMITHLNVLAQCVPENEEVSERKSISITPWFHAMGLISMLQNLVLVRTTVYLPKFEVELYLKTIEKYKITGIVVVPPIIVAISKSPGQYDLSSVQFIHCGAAPLYSETEDLVKAKFPNAIGVFQGYGMTEATMALTTVLKSESDIPNKPGSVGTVMRGTVLKVVDIETRKVLGPNQAGEICAKGMMIMKGYVGREGQDLDDEGFFKTGDVGYFDEDGYFYIVDRLKELIKYKGFQVAPAEIEAELLQHPSVRDAGVIGVPDRSAGEVPLAFVVLQEGSNVSKEEIQQFIAERLSSPKHLRGGVRFVDVIPKNPSGKILRRTLRQMAKSKKSKL